jgi:hypothetical protein
MAERTDAELLEELLAHENRLLSAYEAALRRDAIERPLGELLRDHEREHTRALLETLPDGGRRSPEASVPDAELTAALRDAEAFAAYAVDLEERTVAAYADTIPAIGDPELRRGLGSILACGAAHVVALRNSLGERSLVD